MKKKTLSLLLALALVLSLLPITALATDAPFTASAGGNELKVELTDAAGYPVYGSDPVALYSVVVPAGVTTVDFDFGSTNVLTYYYTSAGGYAGGSDADFMTGATTAMGVPVDADYNTAKNGVDFVQVQTPYVINDGNYESTTLYAITFILPLSASAGSTDLTTISVTPAGYTPKNTDPVTLYTVAIPEDTETVKLAFTEAVPADVLAYNYNNSGADPVYITLADVAAVSVDANKDGQFDVIQVQTTANKVLFAVTFDEVIPVENSEATLLDGLAASYATNGPGTDGNEPWVVADMAAYASLPNAPYALTQAQMETVKDSAILTLSGSPTPGDAAKNIIALVAMGYDPTKLTGASGEFSAKDVLDALTFKGGAVTEAASNMYTLPYVIMAYRLLGDADGLKTLIDKALETKEAWLATGYGVDAMMPFMVALAPDCSKDNDVKAALDEAVGAVKGAQLADGSIGFEYEGVSYPSAASTGLAIAGFTALGIDSHAVKNGDKSLIDGLLSLATDGTSFGNSWDNEQGFRGLIAAANAPGFITYQFDTGNLAPTALTLPYVAFNIQPSTAEAELVFTDANGKAYTPVSANVFTGLDAGTYSYTVTAEGYDESHGTVTVSDKTCETVYVSLARTAPNEDATESTTAVVTVKVLSHDSTVCGGKYTYRHNASAYHSILGDDSSYRVTVVKGLDTARDVLVATLTKYDIPFIEESNGYFSMINNDSGTDHNSPDSGWMYLVNGETPNVAACDYVFNGNATMIWYFTDDYFNEYGSDDWNSDPIPYGDTTTGKTETAATDEDADAVVVAPEVVDGEAKAEVNTEDVTKVIEKSKDADALRVIVDASEADKIEVSLAADAVKAIADAGMGLTVETENGTVKLDSKTLDKLAEDGKDMTLTATLNGDGSMTFGVTSGGENVDVKIKVELPAVGDNQILVLAKAVSNNAQTAAATGANANQNTLALAGDETPVVLSAVVDGVLYAVIPAGATVKVVDAEPMTFGDVKAGDWFAAAVDFVSGHGIFQGTDQGFEPGEDMNRAMLAMVLYRIAGATGGGKSSFDDVDPKAWYADAVSWAADTGIVKGRGEGYAPDAPVTREEIATMLYRFAQYLGVDVSGSAALSAFPDGGKTSAWAKEAMAWAVSVGLFEGDDNGALTPGGAATRAEVATLIERLVELIVK